MLASHVARNTRPLARTRTRPKATQECPLVITSTGALTTIALVPLENNDATLCTWKARVSLGDNVVKPQESYQSLNSQKYGVSAIADRL